jgi:hypothetical protein
VARSRFFRFVWKVDALIIFAAGALAALAVSVATYKMVQHSFFSSKRSGPTVDVVGQPDAKEMLRLTKLVAIEGGPYLMVPLQSEPKSRQSGYGKEPASLRNYLFLNGDDLSMHWLLSRNDHLINKRHFLCKTEPRMKRSGVTQEAGSEETCRVVGILYEIVKKDTDGDKRLTSKDEFTLVVSDSSGRNVQEIEEHVQALVGWKLLDTDLALLLYAKQGVYLAAKLSLRENKILERVDMALPR